MGSMMWATSKMYVTVSLLLLLYSHYVLITISLILNSEYLRTDRTEHYVYTDDFRLVSIKSNDTLLYSSVVMSSMMVDHYNIVVAEI